MADSSARRSRSRSPNRRPPKPKGGFRWKDNSSRSNDNSYDRRDSRRDDARREGSRRDFGRGGGYRDRSPQRDGEKSRHDRYNNRPRSRSPRRRDHYSGDKPDRGVGDAKEQRREARKDEKKDKKAPKPAASSAQEFIVVNVNDRLGTKTQIPCLPSDTVGQFKLMVAARIGRDPGQIMLRRQGERPFKDAITLEDYGVSHGVQLDLEIDTGD